MVLNALDAAALNAEIGRIQPDLIIDELTSLPKRYTHQEMRAAAPRGVKRYVVQPTGFFYGPGQGLAPEEDRLAHGATPGSPAAWPRIRGLRIEFLVIPGRRDFWKEK